MSHVAALLPPDRVVVDLAVASKKRLFEHVAEMLESGLGLSKGVVFDSLFAREKLGSTGLGQGVGIPHGRIKGLKEAAGVFVRLNEAIPFDAPDGLPVRLAFVMLVPEQATELHLQILGELAQMFSDKAFRERLTKAASGEELHALLTGWTPYAADHGSAAV